MASSTSAPSRPLSDAGHKRLSSFPSRQRRMGPAPLASFEDLSMDKTTSDSNSNSSPEDQRKQLSEIGEEMSPLSPTCKGVLSVPTSPRIRVSAASSPSQHDESDSKESTPEKEHFTGYTKTEFCEEMSDLKASTDELDAEDQERARKRRERTQQLVEADRREEALKISELIRKGSSSSVLSGDVLLPFTSAHSSRLSSLGSIGSPARRSPSPHKMLLETSFCGNKPIQHPSIDIEDPPISTSKMMHYTIEKLESIKSPIEMKPPDNVLSTSSSPDKYSAQENKTAQSELNKILDTQKSQARHQEVTKSLQRRQEQQRRQAEHHEYYQRHAEQSENQERAVPHSTDRWSARDTSEEPIPVTERQSRLEKRQSGPNARSPRLAKKVPVPQVPELRDFPRSSPNSSAAPYSATSPDYHNTRSSKSTTPSGSPRPAKKILAKKGRETESDDSPASTSRKSSFASIFRKSDIVLSPITPDSPGSTSGRKSPFSNFIRSAENKFRSRSRSRSRSKSRDRDLEDDTHDRRGVFSIFMPSKKKKQDNEKCTLKEEVADKQKLSDPINNVEFKFNSDSTYQSSSFGLIRQESEVNRAIKEPLRGDSNKMEDPGKKTAENGDSLAEFSSFMNEANRTGSITENFSEEVTKSLKEREKELLDKEAENISNIRNENQESREVHKLVKTTPFPNLDYKPQTNNLDVFIDQEPDSLSISESDKGPEIEYLKKKDHGSAVPLDSPDNENKGLVSQDSFEDEELPYIPTTLPQERSAAAPIIPVRERAPKLKMTQSIDRPRSTTPIHPSRLEAYKQSSQELLDIEADKMTISIRVPPPGAVKVLPTKSPRRQDSKSWEDFCSEGLRSPRQIRRQIKEKEESLEGSVPPPPPPPPPGYKRAPVRQDAQSPDTPSSINPRSNTHSSMSPRVTSSAMTPPRKWINFDEMPSIVLKPVRQIKTVPQQRHGSSSEDLIRDFTMKDNKQSDLKNEKKEVEKTSNAMAFGELPVADESDKDGSVHSSEESDDEKPTSISSSEDLNTVRETVEDIKKHASEEYFDNSDLERLLAPVNECITKLTNLAEAKEAHAFDSRRSPIPDNWEDFLLPPQPGRRSRLSSIGSDAGSIGGGRSPSPSVMLLETSFCGNQPIDDPALAEPDIPISVGDLSPLTPRSERGGSLHSGYFLSQPDRTSIMSDSSAEGGSLKGSDYDPSETQRVLEGHTSHLNPFGMDLEVKSNRSSIVSQDQSPPESPYNSPRHTSS